MTGVRTVPAVTVTDPSVPVHFFAGPGPLDVQRVSRSRWRFPWTLGRVEGTGRRQALHAIYAALLDPLGWRRTGVRWPRTMLTERARLIVDVIPAAQSPCGEGSAGCYSWEPGGGLPRAALGVEYISDPNAFRELVNMEICGHGTFRMADMYTGSAHRPDLYQGVMGTWEGSRFTQMRPSDQEVTSAVDWLNGRVDGSRINADPQD